MSLDTSLPFPRDVEYRWNEKWEPASALALDSRYGDRIILGPRSPQVHGLLSCWSNFIAEVREIPAPPREFWILTVLMDKNRYNYVFLTEEDAKNYGRNAFGVQYKWEFSKFREVVEETEK